MKADNQYLGKLFEYLEGLESKEIKPGEKYSSNGKKIFARKGNIAAVHLSKVLEDSRLLEIVVNYDIKNTNDYTAYKIQLTPYLGQMGFAIEITNNEVTRLGLLKNDDIIPNKIVKFPEADLLYLSGAKDNFDRFMEYTFKNIQV